MKSMIDKIIISKYSICFFFHFYDNLGHGYFLINLYRFKGALSNDPNPVELVDLFL